MAAAGVSLAVILGLVLWPDGDGTPAVETRAQLQDHARTAAEALEALPAVELSAVYVPGQDGAATRAQLTVTAGGQATGTLQGPASGKADLAWSGDQLYLKGDAAFWAQQEPFHGHDLTSSGHWVAPEKRSGYYMLDSFGVNAGSLTPKALAEVVRQIVSDPGAVVEDAGLQGGRPVTSFVGRTGTVVVTAAAPYQVVALGVDPVDAGPVTTAMWHTGAGSRSAAGGRRAVPAGYGDSDPYQPYLFLGPKPATAAQAAAVGSDAAAAASASVPPASTDVAVASAGPAFKVDLGGPDLCETDLCPYTVTVTNQGDQPADAVLHVSFQGRPLAVHPLGTLAPKESKQISGSTPNAAKGTNSTVTVTYDAWVYSAASYGPDPAVAERLRARKLDPQEIVAPPLRPMVSMLLDAFTREAAQDDTAANDAARDLLEKADNHGHIPLLADLVSSGRVQNIKDLPALMKKAYSANNPGGIRELENAGHFVRNNPDYNVIVDGSYPLDGVTYKADILALPADGGTAGADSVQIKTVNSRRNFAEAVDLGARQLTGEAGVNGEDKFPDNSPPGFKRVLQLNIEPKFPELFGTSKSDLEYDLFNLRKWEKIRSILCEKRAGGNDLRVQRLIIVNGSGVSTWDNLPDLCAVPPKGPMPTWKTSSSSA
ncbi:hypothetical protein ACFV1L_08350 [Kitasatospora sp. NPDC059646]|uniref:hypothetical protein n=1 Tax=Kitasatospora sp. NPDC059646 TaxID=3346893 RepID=UPI00367C0F9E